MDLLLGNKALNHVVDKLLGNLAVVDPDAVIRILDDDGLSVDRVRDLPNDFVASNGLFECHPCHGLFTVLERQLCILVVGGDFDDNPEILGSFLVSGQGILSDSTAIVALGVFRVDFYCLVSIPIGSECFLIRNEFFSFHLILLVSLRVTPIYTTYRMAAPYSSSFVWAKALLA